MRKRRLKRNRKTKPQNPEVIKSVDLFVEKIFDKLANGIALGPHYSF